MTSFIAFPRTILYLLSSTSLPTETIDAHAYSSSMSDDVITSSSSPTPLLSTSPADVLDLVLEGTRFVVQRIVSLIIVVFGIAGNLMSIAVLTRRSMKSSTNRYLCALAVFDALYLVFALSMTVQHYDVFRRQPWYIHYCYPYGRSLTDICSNTAVWLTLTFTIERYIGVCYPMKGKVWCTPRRAQGVVAVVCFVALLVTLPVFFEFRVEEMTDQWNNTRLITKTTEFGRTASYQIGYFYANQIFFTFLPLLLLFAFNSFLIRAVMHATRNRRRMTLGDLTTPAATNSLHSSQQERHQRDQQRITVMLIVVVVVFVVCQLPQAVQTLCRIYLQRADLMGGREERILKITGNYFNLLVMINSSINFVLYSSFSSKFRLTFARIFCHRFQRPPEGRSSADSFPLGIHRTSCVPTELTTTFTTEVGGGGEGRRRTMFRSSMGDFSLEAFEGNNRRRSRSASIATTDRIFRSSDAAAAAAAR